MSGYVRLSQVKSGLVRIFQVTSGYDMVDQIRIRLVRLFLVMSGYAKLGLVIPG